MGLNKEEESAKGDEDELTSSYNPNLGKNCHDSVITLSLIPK